MKLIKVTFTSWRNQSNAPGSLSFQRQLDYWTTRISVLSRAAVNTKEQLPIADSDGLQKSLAGIAADAQKIDDGRTLLLSAEEAAAIADASAASEYQKAGTVGYQVFNDAGSYLAMIVDEAGDQQTGTAQSVPYYSFRAEGPRNL